MGSTDRGAGAHLPSLTGFRFVAALAVFGCHAMLSLPDSPARNGLSHVFSQGFVGVSFFFVLGGFILAWTHEPDDTTGRFYRRRAARVLPAYWVALVVAVTIDAAFGWGQSAVQILPSVAAAQAFFPDQQVHFAGNTVGWSLSAEVFFYALFPLLLVVMRSRPARSVLLVVAVLAIFVVPALLPGSDESTRGYWIIGVLPVQRLAEFVLGMGLAQLMRTGWRMPVGLRAALALAAVAYLAVDVAPVSFSYVAVTVIPLLVLIGAAAQSDLDGAPSLLRHPVMIRLGEWSYSFYLVHLVVLRLVLELSRRAGLPVTDDVGVAAVVVVGCLPLSIAVAAALHHAVERPLERRLRGRQPGQPQQVRSA